MNDLTDIDALSDVAIMKMIGTFIQDRRIASNLTQEETAGRAAMSRSTLSLAERGESTTVANLLKILRVLDCLYVLEPFRSRETISPIRLAQEEEKRRKRASRHQQLPGKDDTAW
ncbi:MAG: transcriptional regulator [Bacteroidetes bacterium 47-18]|nr:MAG: transcriptional regulator [Bacteroidetes bacterium 47-18]